MSDLAGTPEFVQPQAKGLDELLDECQKLAWMLCSDQWQEMPLSRVRVGFESTQDGNFVCVNLERDVTVKECGKSRIVAASKLHANLVARAIERRSRAIHEANKFSAVLGLPPVNT